MLRALLSLLVIAGSVQAACIGVEGREILAGDLVKLEGAFSKLDPAIVFSYAPTAGAQREVAGSEIDKWAAAHGLGGMHNPDVCFARVTHSLTPDDISHAVAEFLGTKYEDLRIEVVEVCRCQITSGRIDLSFESVSAPPIAHPETPVLLRGRVVGKDGTAYPIWARVRVLASMTLVRTTETLRTGQTIAKQDLEAIKLTASPFTFHEVQNVAAYESKIMSTSLVRGSILEPSLVHAPSDVERGSLVNVTVSSGSAYLALEARAETAGNTGQNITLTNPMGAARFQATVTGPGQAEIVVSRQRAAGPHLGPVARQMESNVSGGGL